MKDHPLRDMLEDTVEQHFVKGVEKLGGRAFKFKVVNFRGVPDRICFLPCALLLLVECKRPVGGRLSTLQKRVGGWLNGLGFTVYVVYTRQQADALLQQAADIIERGHNAA